MVILAGLKEVSGYSLQRRVYGLKPSLPGTQAGDVMEGLREPNVKSNLL
jgi:hypothetical protein